MKIFYIVGIDEVGRGPLAGPVTLCACAVAVDRQKALFAGVFKKIRDSKKLSPATRELFSRQAKIERKNGSITYAISHVSAWVIDRVGISRAVSLALGRCLAKLDLPPAQCRILLDGSLRAPAHFPNQKTIIGGDDSVPIISLASVIAKVARDKKMTRLAEFFPEYGLEIHKGYGTKRHQAALRRHGLSALHRRTFCKKFQSRK